MNSALYSFCYSGIFPTPSVKHHRLSLSVSVDINVVCAHIHKYETSDDCDKAFRNSIPYLALCCSEIIFMICLVHFDKREAEMLETYTHYRKHICICTVSGVVHAYSLISNLILLLFLLQVIKIMVFNLKLTIYNIKLIFLTLII